MREAINRGTLWTLRKGNKTVQADVREIEGVGLELRYLWDGVLMQSHLFRDGTELLKEATTKRFELEESGWASLGLPHG
jgi:hypothetical protein